MFTQKDLQQIRSKGCSIDDINQQIKHFQQIMIQWLFNGV